MVNPRFDNGDAFITSLLHRYRGTKELSNGPKYTITREGDRCILVINNLTADDIDEYSIKIRNKGGAKMSRCNVNVRCKLSLALQPSSHPRSSDLAPPRFRLPAKYQDVLNYDKGETIVLKIPYSGSPTPNVSLSKDGQDLSGDRNVSIDVGDRMITLTIRNTDKNTSGPYKIRLHNNLGEDEATLRINVSGDTECRRPRSHPLVSPNRCSWCTEERSSGNGDRRLCQINLVSPRRQRRKLHHELCH